MTYHDETAYWPSSTDWGVGSRYYVVPRNDGTYAVEDGDSDRDAPPMEILKDRDAAMRICRDLNR